MAKKYPTISDKKKLYNTYAKLYQKRTIAFTRMIALDYRFFLESLSGKKILDLGCGPGRDSAIFKKKGYNPLCLDISEEMLNLCKAKGLKTLKINIEKLFLPEKSFAGIWSYTCLTTIPKKKVWKIINKLHKILKSDGVLFLGLIEGTFEGWKKADQKYSFQRYVSRYETEEVMEKLSEKFELLYFRKIGKKETGRNTYLNFLFRKL